MKKIILALALASPTVFAGTVYQNLQPSQVVPYSADHRVLYFGTERHWFTQEGTILVCPYSAEISVISYPSVDSCKNPNKSSGWIQLTDFKIAGFEMTGISYTQNSSSTRSLYVYLQRSTSIKPTQTQVVNDTIAINNLTINANSVMVQRKKK